MTRACGDCEFFLRYEGGDSLGTCKRLPPTPLPLTRDDPCRQALPQMHQDDWCGLFAPLIPVPEGA